VVYLLLLKPKFEVQSVPMGRADQFGEYRRSRNCTGMLSKLEQRNSFGTDK